MDFFQRIDIIYSKNFDKIFIGVVKNDTTYINRLIIIINTIDKFIMTMESESNNFQVLLKDRGSKIEICTFLHQKKDSLENLIFFLNGKLEDINEGVTNNYGATS